MKAPETMPGVVRKSVDVAGQRSTRQAIICAGCGGEEMLSPTGGFYSPDHMKKIFTAKGWRVAKKGDHTCPDCIKKEADAMADTAPREPQPADNRRIFARLMEVYDERNSRYCDDCTDHSVAKELAVPRRWVETIREANFGPAGKNAEMDKVAAAIGSLAADAKRHADEAMALAAKSEDLVRRAEALSERVHKIEMAVGPRAA